MVPRHHQEVRDEWGPGSQVSLSFDPLQAQRLAFVALCRVQDTSETDAHQTQLVRQ